MTEARNCVDIVKPFVDALERGDYAEGQMIGGIGSAVLGHPDVEILPDEKLVIAPAGIHLPQHRDKKQGGTLRDVDFLVLSDDPEDVKAVDVLAKEHIGDQLEPSVFGLKPHSKLESQKHHPILGLAKVIVADRYVEMVGGEAAIAKKSFFPIAVDMDPATLATWQCVLNKDYIIPIPAPGASLLNYVTRASYGLRPKDEEKVTKLANNIGDKAPEIIDWIHDGPGASQFELARLLRTMGEPTDSPTAQQIGKYIQIVPPQLEGILEHDAFMLKDSTPAQQIAFLKAAHYKAQANRWGETLAHNNPQVMAVWQDRVEPKIDRLLKNEA
jgi:hypothetical protein